MKTKSSSKKNKKSWRNCDVKDVESFLEDQSLEDRLGGSFNDKPDKDFFFIDQEHKSSEINILSKKAKSVLPPRCFKILQPCTSVADPIKKRNIVSNKNKRTNPTMKSFRNIKGKHDVGKQYKNKLKLIKETNLSTQNKDCNTDLWNSNLTNSILDSWWLEDETNHHVHWNTKKLKVNHIKKITKNIKGKVTSALPVINICHPGMSYNPSLIDHKELLHQITHQELQLVKEDQHLNRVTNNMFSKLTPEENHTLWLSEMSEGLPNGTCEIENCNGDYETINKPTSFNKKKTLKARRKQKESKKEIHEKRKFQIEKRKIADIYKLKKMEKEIAENDKQVAKEHEKRIIKKVLDAKRTKNLAKKKFQEPDLEFNRPHEIAGNLRALKPEGNILTDRFYSMQRRNIIEVTSKQFKCHKRKVKMFLKPSHRIQEMEKQCN